MAKSVRIIWKGAISFGLVHIPVGLHTATTESGVDFDWLDKRTMDPVGYKRINKRTGREIDRENIVKGVEYQDGEYVVLSPEEINDAYPRTTQTIEIERFVDVGDVPFIYLERPYYIAPINKGHKVYALLRDTLAEAGKLGIAKVVIQTKQHLAALIPSGDALVLNLLRWGEDVKSTDSLDLPTTGAKAMMPSVSELRMAKMLIDDMSGKWDPDAFKDEFKHAILTLVEKRAKAGKTHTVFEPEEEAPQHADNVIDLTALLQQSLKKRGGVSSVARKTSAQSRRDTAAAITAPRQSPKTPSASRKPAAVRKAASRKAPARKIAKGRSAGSRTSPAAGTAAGARRKAA